LDNVIAWPEDVKAFTKSISWNLVGKDFEGETEALIFEIPEEKIVKESARDAIRDRRKVQGSVSMVYVKVDMAIDSKEKEYAYNKQVFDSYINEIANKEVAIEQGFYFLVSEAKIAREGSMVLLGSNDATEIIYPDMPDDEEMDDMEDDEKGCRRRKKVVEPSDDTQEKIEPPVEDTQKESIDYKFLITNLKN
jgi:hypothetical protein